MTKIPDTFYFGSPGELTPERIILIMQDMYKDLAVAINRKPDIITRSTDGIASESFLSNGDININLSTNKVEMVTNHPTVSTVTWTQLS